MKKFLLFVACLCASVFAFAQTTTAASSSTGAASAPPTNSVQSGEFGLQATIFNQVQGRTPSPGVSGYEASTQANLDALARYVPTPGDVYLVTIASSASTSDTGGTQQLNIQIHPDYSIQIPFSTSVSARNMGLFDLLRLIERNVRQSMPPASFVSCRLLSMAQFNIFVYGGVQFPGEITANAMTRVIDVISIARGFKPNASYRNIILQRGGQEISLDLSHYYLNGDFSVNPFVQPGDRIFVPEAEKIVTVTGSIAYAGVYELAGDETLEDLIAFAGGFQANALTSRIRLSQWGARGELRNAFIDYENGRDTALGNGDQVDIPTTAALARPVIVEGAVYGAPNQDYTAMRIPSGSLAYFTGVGSGGVPEDVPLPIRLTLAYHEGMTLFEVLIAVGGPTPFAILDECVIMRPDGEVVPFDPDLAMSDTAVGEAIQIEPGDIVRIPIQNPTVVVSGEVNNPGVFPFRRLGTVTDYLRLAGGFTRDALRGAVYLMSPTGERLAQLSLTDPVETGSILYIERNADLRISETIDTTFRYIGYGTMLLGIITTIYNFGLEFGWWGDPTP